MWKTSLPSLSLVITGAFVLYTSCSPIKRDHELAAASPEDLEAREDSVELAAAYQRQTVIKWFVTPDAETSAIQAASEEDAADDPAVWINPTDPSQSLVIGSNKRGGIAVYDLNGKELAYYPVGNINNVDVAYGVTIGDQKMDLVGGSNRSDQSIDLFRIDPLTRQLHDVSSGPFLTDTTLMDDIYGFCFYQSPKTGQSYVMVNAKNGRFQQYLITTVQDTLAGLQLVRDILFDSQVEGLVADNRYGHLYIGEENRGVWKLDAEADGSRERRLIPMSGADNPNISYDVEGVTLYEQGDSGYLIVSSQGNFSYAVFDRRGENEYLFSFKILGSSTVDGVEETDGLQAISADLGPAFPKGLLVVQDGFNYNGDTLVAQNFKLISWEKIEALSRK